MNQSDVFASENRYNAFDEGRGSVKTNNGTFEKKTILSNSQPGPKPMSDINFNDENYLRNSAAYTWHSRQKRLLGFYEGYLYRLSENGHEVYRADKDDNKCTIINEKIESCKCGGEPWGYKALFVNHHGIFLLALGADRGEIAALYDFNGNKKNSLSVIQKGRLSDKNRFLAMDVVESTVFASTETKLFICDLETGNEYAYEYATSLRIKGEFKRLAASTSDIYIEMSNDMEMSGTRRTWHKISLNPDKSIKEISRLITYDPNKYPNFWLFPKQNCFWIYESKNKVFKKYNLDRKYVKELKAQPVRWPDPIYFDGTIAVYGVITDGNASFDVQNFSSNVSFNVTGMFDNDKDLYVTPDKIYGLKDFGFFKHRMVEIDLNGNDAIEICGRF